MAGIRDFFNFFQQAEVQTKQAPQVVLSTTNTNHYRRDNYEAYADEGRVNSCIEWQSTFKSSLELGIYLFSELSLPYPLPFLLEYWIAVRLFSTTFPNA